MQNFYPYSKRRENDMMQLASACSMFRIILTMVRLPQHEGRPSENFRLRFRVDPSKEFTSWEITYTYFKNCCCRERLMTVVERRLHERKELCGFHIWCAKTMSSSRGVKLILQYERLTGTGLT